VIHHALEAHLLASRRLANRAWSITPLRWYCTNTAQPLWPSGKQGVINHAPTTILYKHCTTSLTVWQTGRDQSRPYDDIAHTLHNLFDCLANRAWFITPWKRIYWQAGVWQIGRDQSRPYDDIAHTLHNLIDRLANRAWSITPLRRYCTHTAQPHWPSGKQGVINHAPTMILYKHCTTSLTVWQTGRDQSRPYDDIVQTLHNLFDRLANRAWFITPWKRIYWQAGVWQIGRDESRPYDDIAHTLHNLFDRLANRAWSITPLRRYCTHTAQPLWPSGKQGV